MDLNTAYHFGNQPPYPLASLPPQPYYHFGNPNVPSPYHQSMPPYYSSNDYHTPQYPSQVYLTPQQMEPPLPGNMSYYPPVPYDPPWYSTFLETFCCCLGYGPPKTMYEAMHRDEMERRRFIEKSEKYRRAQHQKALEESRRQSLIQSKQQASLKTNGTVNSINEQSNSQATPAS